MSIEYFVLAGLILLFLFLGYRGYSKAQKKEIADYGIKYINVPLNPVMWSLKTSQERNIVANKVIVCIFTLLSVLIHPLFLLFVISMLLLNLDFFEENSKNEMS